MMRTSGSISTGYPGLAALFTAFGLMLLAGASALAQGLQHDETKPIEITADSLEVEQEAQIATFIGNVDAVQGDLVLSADTLKVSYEGKSEAGGLAAGTGGKISQIEASGDVILSSPGETAEGDIGVYDVPAQVITLKGDVVLTRGDNVLRGEHLELDVATGKSRMVGTPAVADADGVTTPSGRVKALFTPKQRENDKEKARGEAKDVDPDAPFPPLPLARP